MGPGVAAAWLALSLTLLPACTEPVDSGAPAGVVCTDSQTGYCIPCAGSGACVDPFLCVAIQCASKDIQFGNPGGDADATPVTDSGGDDDATAGGDGDGDGDDDETETADDISDTTTPPTDVIDDSVSVDTQPPSDTSDDSATPDAADTGLEFCLGGAKGCAGNRPKVCVFGTWQTLATCPAGKKCSGGDCVCDDECPALNLTECLGAIAATHTCQLGGDGCLFWGLPIACPTGQACVLGICKEVVPCEPACGGGQICEQGLCVDKACVPSCGGGQICDAGVCVDKPTGTLTCAQVTACISQNCGPGDDACKLACRDQGKVEAQTAYDTLVNCGKATCKKLVDEGKNNEAMFCMYTWCGQEQAACMGAGAGTCQGLNDCLNDCSLSAVCNAACHSDASVDSAQDFYALMTCVEQKCGALPASEQAACGLQWCKSTWDKCFPPQGTLSCQQILACAGQCGSSKECAQGCKAKGTASGVAQLDALLACHDDKCGTFCNEGGDAQLCNTCLNTFCSAQYAGCK